MDYAEYVKANILVPLEMEQTAVSAGYGDNEWVRQQRKKEKSYLIVGNRQMGLVTDENLGSAIRYIQIYPAGSVTGTLEDMTKFAQAFVDEECPLFENQETLEFMLSASDFYGDSDIPKNCHGLWCTEYAVRTMGHAGNTTGGSANLVFDRESKVGVVVMTNQQYETLFCYDIPKLVFGGIDENPLYKNATITTTQDVSGDYVMSRGIFEGGGKGYPCLTYMPVRASEEKGVFTQLDEPMLIQFGDNLYRLAGSNDFVYATTTSDGELVLEYSMMTLLRDEAVEGESSAVTIFAGIVVAGLILLLVMGIRKVFRLGEKIPAAKWIVVGVIAILLAGILFFAPALDTMSMEQLPSIELIQVLNVVLCSGIMVCMVGCLVSAGVAAKTAIMEKGLKLSVRLMYVVYTLCLLYVIGFAVYFRLFQFWT